MHTNPRALKVEWLKNAISIFFNERPNESISKKKLLAEFMFATYASERTGKEILNAMEAVGEIKINGDIITR